MNDHNDMDENNALIKLIKYNYNSAYIIYLYELIILLTMRMKIITIIIII